MRTFEKPVVFLSKCLAKCNCRFDGGTIASEVVDRLAPYVTYVTSCPEMAIGLPSPREALRIVRDANGDDHLVFSRTGGDISESMNDFTSAYLDELAAQGVDGFILQHRSPSCGANDVKIYSSHGKSNTLPGKTSGFFGRAVLDRFPQVPVENEGRLLNFNLREHFMIRIFMLKDFKRTVRAGNLASLVAFHTDNKYLLMAFSQKQLTLLGKLLANHDHLPFSVLAALYEANLLKALELPLSTSRNVNALLHIFGYFKNHLSSDEKAFFLENLELYSCKRLPLSALLKILKAWVVRFDDPYLKRQTIFEPFPSALFEVTDSGKGL